MQKYRPYLTQVQRSGALQVVSAYRTFLEAAVVIARVIPVAFLVKKRKAIYSYKVDDLREVLAREERQCTLTD